MNQEVAWTFPYTCPHCGEGKANTGDAEVTYKCLTALVDDREYRGYECFESEFEKLRAKIEALVKAGDRMTPDAYADELNEWNKAKGMK